MRNVVKYLCVVVLLIGTSAHAWGQAPSLSITEQVNVSYSNLYGDFGGTAGGEGTVGVVTTTATNAWKDGSNGYIKIKQGTTFTVSTSDGLLTQINFSPYTWKEGGVTKGGMANKFSANSGNISNALWSNNSGVSSVTFTASAGEDIYWRNFTVTLIHSSSTCPFTFPTSISMTVEMGQLEEQTVNITGTTGYSIDSYSVGLSSYDLGGGSGSNADVSDYNAIPSTIQVVGEAPGTYYGTFDVSYTRMTPYSHYELHIPVTVTVTAECTTNPTVPSGSSSDIRSTTATVSCSGISSLGSAGCTISSYGFVVSTTSNPTIGGSGVTKWQVGTSYTVTGTSFSQGLTGLSPYTTYYVKPYATNGHGTSYGSQFSFKTLQRYTITYNNNGGEGTIANEYKDYGIAATLNAGTNFSRTGYTLSGWNSNAAGTGNSFALSGSYTTNGNLTCHAVWTPNPYTITLNNQDATTTGTTSISVTYDANTNLSGTPAITVPTKTGYEFGGYYTGTNGSGDQIIAANGNVNASVDGFTSATKQWIYANSIELYAKWTANTINLTLSRNGVTGTDGSASVKYDATELESGTTHATNSDANYHLVGYYAEAGTSTKVLESNGAFAATTVSGYITDGKWSRTTSPTTLYAKWVMTTYTVTFNMHGHGEAIASQEVESGSKVAEPATPNVGDAVGGWRFLGWFTDDGAGSATNTNFDFANTTITANTTIHAKWEEITYSTDYLGWCAPDITITGDIHLTSVNGVSVYATSTTNNLIRIQSNDLAGVNKLEIKYLDADDGDAEVAKGSSVFRFCNNGIENFNVADGSQIDVSASNTYDQTFSISYTPTAYNVVNHYKLQITMKHNTNVLKTVTHDLYGRSLPEEFVVASKFKGEWYALPNTLEATEVASRAVAGVKITVDNTTTPTAATYAPDITVYKGEGRYAANSNRYGVRLTDGTNHLQVSTTGSNNKMWLSSTGSAACQDWWLSSSNFGAYSVTIPSNTGNETKKIGMDGGNIGYYASPTSPSEQIYFLPITNKIVDNPASVTEWGKKKVILDVDAQGMAGARAHIGDGEPETANLFGQTRTSVKSAASKYNYTIGFSSTDFSAHKGELLYVDWLDGEGEVVSTSAVTIPWIIAENTTMSDISTTQAHWKDWEVHVLSGVTFTADGASGFASSTAKIYTLEIYPGATVNVSSGILDVTQNLVLRNGWTRAGSKEYDVARLYIPSTSTLKTKHVYADWYIDFDQYYPVAVPWETTIANFSYKNSNTAATINGTSGTLRLRYYDGASRAANGQAGVGEGINWKAYGADGANAVPDKMVPSMGYAMTAKRPTGKAFSIVRMPLTIPAATWTAEGEHGYISSDHKDQITVAAHGADDPSKPWYTIGWNFIANPYMATYNGDGDDASITGKLITQGGGSVKYATIPNLEFTNYDQLPVATADLKPSSPFFVQVGTGGTLTFSNSKIVDPSAAPARYTKATEDIPEQEAYIRLSGATGKDQMGLIIGEDYTEAYEPNADLTKVLGVEGYVKTYMQYGGMDMAYVAINATLAKEWIPITVKIPANGEYTYSLTNGSIVDNLEGIYLIDYANDDKVTNLMENNYTFWTTSGTVSGRFAINAIVGEHKTPTGIDAVSAGADLNSDKPFKFIYREKVYILYRGVIYDATGKKVK